MKDKDAQKEIDSLDEVDSEMSKAKTYTFDHPLVVNPDDLRVAAMTEGD